MGKDLQKLAEKIAEAARKGVAVERLWQQQLEAELKQKQAKGSKEPADAKAILLDNSSRTSIGWRSNWRWQRDAV
jgi:hypothetical protein